LRLRGAGRGLALPAALGLALFASAARAEAPAAAVPPPVVVPGVPPGTPPPPLPPPVVEPPAPAPAGAMPYAQGGAVLLPPPPSRPGPVPTSDAEPSASDHDAVVGHVGIEARRLTPAPFPLALRTPGGCPAALTTPCTVDIGALEARYWMTRNLALAAGLALALGGGGDQGRPLDTFAGVGPVVGLSLLLGNWRHLAVSASPEVSWLWFKPGGGAPSTTLVDVRAALEGELHFGFVGVPALSVGLIAGLGMRYESTPDTRVWSVGVIGAGSVWGALTNLFLRYYL
jgi:hypothetical protein